MPLIPQQDFIFIDLQVYGDPFFNHKTASAVPDLVKEALEDYPPVKIISFTYEPGGIMMLVETI